MFLWFVSGQGQRVVPTIGNGFHKPRRCDAAQAGGESPQIDIGKPGVGVNTRLRTVFINHEAHETHEEKQKKR